MRVTETKAERGSSYLREVDAVIARKRHPAGALMPIMQPVAPRPEDPVQRILRDGDELFLTLDEAAAQGKVTIQTILSMLKDGTLRGCRFGKRRTLVSLDSFIECFRPWRPAEDDDECDEG